jgi:thiol-disulfide isomerase/thioredoxin
MTYLCPSNQFIMKFLLFPLILLLAVQTQQAQTWTWISMPKAGTNAELRITGAPTDEGELHVAFYTFDGTKLMANDAALFPGDKANELKVQVVLPENASWVYLALKTRYNEVKSGTSEFLTNEKNYPFSGRLEKAVISSIYYRPLGIEKDDQENLKSFREALESNPGWFDQPEILKGYLLAANAAKSTSDQDNIKAHLAEISKKPKDYPEALLVQSVRTAKILGDSTLQATLRKGLDKVYPKSILAQEDLLVSFQKAVGVDEKIKIRDQFISKYPETDDNRAYLDQMTSSLADLAANQQDWAKVKTYVDQMRDPMSRARVCNTYAWTLSGESPDKPGSNYEIAEALSATSLQLLTPDATKPVYLTKNEWVNTLENMKAGYGDTYALIRYKQGHLDDALDHQLFAVQNSAYEDPDMNERYAIYLQKAGQNKDLEEFMDKIMVMGKASPKVREIHKEYWTKTATTDQLYNQYLAQLEAKAHDLLVEKVLKSWKEEDPVDFTLKDLEGNSVSLSDYKGKTVIIDFWATWCGPCKASFPGMKKAVEHFASDKDVVFLFVDTWENPENRETRVSDFIHTFNYPFHVLIDGDNAVVGNYKVGGIPTKFIIGPDQKLRFVSVGFGGNVDELFEEMKIMIELARNGSIVRT